MPKYVLLLPSQAGIVGEAVLVVAERRVRPLFQHDAHVISHSNPLRKVASDHKDIHVSKMKRKSKIRRPANYTL